MGLMSVRWGQDGGERGATAMPTQAEGSRSHVPNSRGASGGAARSLAYLRRACLGEKHGGHVGTKVIRSALGFPCPPCSAGVTAPAAGQAEASSRRG